MITGSFVGLCKILDFSNNIEHPVTLSKWSLTAGAKSLFLLSKISSARGASRLRAHLFKDVGRPVSQRDHYLTFKSINYLQHDPWCSEVLFFPKIWYEQINSPKLAPLKLYLLEKAWVGSAQFRNQFLWKSLFTAIKQRLSYKPSSYISDLAAHLFAVANGALPGFQVATDDGCGPVSMLQDLYKNVYKLDYAPMMMEPGYFSPAGLNDKNTYFSIQHNSALELSQRASERSSNITQLYELSLLVERYLEELMSTENPELNAPIEHLKNFHFKFYHAESRGDIHAIEHTDTLFDTDKEFKYVMGQFPLRKPPLTSPFFKGCIQMF